MEPQPLEYELPTPLPASRRVRVAEQFPNPDDPSSLPPVQAYAKLAGHDWTYYIVDTTIAIGRAPESTDHAPLPSSSDTVHVDLGPAKTVSRRHATIQYNYHSGTWDLYVLGRNGVKVDGTIYKPSPHNEPASLASGSFLELGGVQFIFLLPETEPVEALNEPEDGSTHLEVDPAPAKRIYKKRTRKSSPDPTAKRAPKKPKIRARNSSTQPNAGPALDIGDLSGGNDQEIEFVGLGDESRLDFLADVTSSLLNLEPEVPDHHIPLLPLTIDGEIPDFVQRKHDIDYSDDANQSKKPPHSYASLIAEAICASPVHALSLGEIYEYLTIHYAYFRHAKHSWHNSIRHNLSLNRAFVKRTRSSTGPGKGCLWTIDPDRAYEIRDEMRKPKKRAAELFGLDKPGPPSAAQLAAAAADFGIPPAQPHPFFNPFPSFHGGAPGFPGGVPFSMTGAPFHASAPFMPSMMPFAPMMSAPHPNNPSEPMGHPAPTNQQGSEGIAEIPIHARKPIRSYYSLHHTTPDLTLLPTASGLMRSLPKLFNHFHLMDAPLPEGDVLYGNLVDRDTFPELGMHLALTKERLMRSKAVHDHAIAVHTLVSCGNASGVTRIAGGSGVCSSPIVSGQPRQRGPGLGTLSSQATAAAAVERAVELAVQWAQGVRTLEGSSLTNGCISFSDSLSVPIPTDDMDLLESLGGVHDADPPPTEPSLVASGDNERVADNAAIATRKRSSRKGEASEVPETQGTDVLVLHTDDATSHAISHASSAAAAVSTACALIHAPGAQFEVQLAGLIPLALCDIMAKLVTLPVTQIITALIANMLSMSLTRLANGGFDAGDPQRHCIEQLVLDAEKISEAPCHGTSVQVSSTLPLEKHPSATQSPSTQDSTPTDVIDPFLGMLSAQPPSTVPPSVLQNPLSGPYAPGPMSFGYLNAYPMMPGMGMPSFHQRPFQIGMSPYSHFNAPPGFSSFGLAGYYARMMASHQLVMQGRVGPQGALVGPPSMRQQPAGAKPQHPDNASVASLK